MEEPGEALPAPEHVVHGLGHRGEARQPHALGAHPRLNLDCPRRAALAEHREAPFGRLAVDLAFDVKQRFEALDSLQGERRDGPRAFSISFAGPECRQGGVKFARSDRAAGLFVRNPLSTVESPEKRTGSGCVQFPACSVVAVADAAEMVDVAPMHSIGNSNGSIVALDEHRNDKTKDGTHSHDPREAHCDVGRW